MSRVGRCRRHLAAAVQIPDAISRRHYNPICRLEKISKSQTVSGKAITARSQVGRATRLDPIRSDWSPRRTRRSCRWTVRGDRSFGVPVRAIVDPAPRPEPPELADSFDRQVGAEDVQVLQLVEPGQRRDRRVGDVRVIQPQLPEPDQGLQLDQAPIADVRPPEIQPGQSRQLADLPQPRVGDPIAPQAEVGQPAQAREMDEPGIRDPRLAQGQVLEPGQPLQVGQAVVADAGPVQVQPDERLQPGEPAQAVVADRPSPRATGRSSRRSRRAGRGLRP